MRQFEVISPIESDSYDAHPQYPQQEEQPGRSIWVSIVLLGCYWISRRHFYLSLILGACVRLLFSFWTRRGGMMSSPEDADTNSLLRQGSKKLWRRLSREPTTTTNGSHTDLDAELEEDRTSNSGNYSQLKQPTASEVCRSHMSIVYGACDLCTSLVPIYSGSNHDRLCNGSVHPDGSFTRKPIPILSHQNSFGSPPTLSPQNSIRSNGSSPRTPSPFNLTVFYYLDNLGKVEIHLFFLLSQTTTTTAILISPFRKRLNPVWLLKQTKKHKSRNR